jgi:trehalose 6-phosphate phosphatase
MMPERKPLPVVENHIELEQFFSALAQSPFSALMLDYDGTLSPFSINRHQAIPYEGVIPLLRAILLSGRTRLAIITGRDAYEVVSLLGIHPPPEIWGSHGLQGLRPDGTSDMPQLDERVSQALSDASDWLTQQKLQNLEEVKPGGIAVHWRGLTKGQAVEVRDRVLLGWFPIAQDALMTVLEFDGGIEMRVPDFDKGDAVRAIVNGMDADAPIAYLGDDATDEQAFNALGDRGLTALVRPAWRKTAARLWLKPPEDLLDFLTRWLHACGGSSTAAPGGAHFRRGDR